MGRHSKEYDICLALGAMSKKTQKQRRKGVKSG